MPDVDEPVRERCGENPASECEHCFAVVLCSNWMREHIRDEHQ